MSIEAMERAHNLLPAGAGAFEVGYCQVGIVELEARGKRLFWEDGGLSKCA